MIVMSWPDTVTHFMIIFARLLLAMMVFMRFSELLFWMAMMTLFQMLLNELNLLSFLVTGRP